MNQGTIENAQSLHIFLGVDRHWAEAPCRCLLSAGGKVGEIAFTYCDGRRNALDPSNVQTTAFAFNDAEAKGEIKVSREHYGLAIEVNGVRLALADLFYLSPRWREQKGDKNKPACPLSQGGDHSRILIYTGDDNEGPVMKDVPVNRST